MKNSKVCLMLFFFPILSLATIVSKSSSGEILIQKQFPNSKTLVQTECKIGSAKIKSIGYLIQKESIQGSAHPLVPLIAYMDKEQWILNEIPKRLEYSKGSAADFLSDFWNPKTASLHGKYEIRCAAPNEDKDIATSANGEFSKKFINKKSGQHICFQADSIYNSWACFNFNHDTKKIESSFSQMNAD